MSAPRDPNAPPAVISRIYERYGCWFVEGKVHKKGEWLTAKLTVYKGDVLHMSQEQFEQYALRNLPNATEDIRWEEHATA